MMKKSALLFLLAIALTLSLFSSGHQAQAASPKPAFAVAVELCPACAARKRCLRACLEEFEQDLKDAKKVCTHCTFSALGICLASESDPDCIKSMREKAEELHQACKNACKPPVPSPGPKPKPKPAPTPKP